MRVYFKDSRAVAHCSLMVGLFLLLLKFNSSIQVAARSVGGQHLHNKQLQQQPLQQQPHSRHQRMHAGGRQAITLPIWHSIFPAAATIESSRAVVAGTDMATTLALTDVSKRRHIAVYDDDDDIDIEHVDDDDDNDDDDDYADNFENFATHADNKNGMKDETLATHPDFVYIKPKSKLRPTQHPAILRSRLFALKAQATTPAPGSATPLLGRNVDRPIKSPDEGRTFFHHKGQAGPQFLVLTTPLNLTNINNNNITLDTTTTVAPGRRIAFIDDGYAPTGLYRKPILRQAFRRRAQSDNTQLPYGLLSTWDDNAQVLPLAAATAVMQSGGDLRYVPLDLRRLSAAHAQAPTQVQLNPGYGSSFAGSSLGADVDDNNGDDNDNDDFGNALDSNNAGYSRFSAPWRINSNRLNANLRNVYESPNPFATFANSFKRVQYL